MNSLPIVDPTKQRNGNDNRLRSGHTVAEVTALPCNKCAAKEICPKYQQDAKCWYELNDERPDLTTGEGILSMIRTISHLDFTRYQRALRYDAARG